MGLQAYYESCCTGNWKDQDPEVCGCRGSGWWLSDLDIEFQCNIHYDGQPSVAHGSEEEWEDYFNKKDMVLHPVQEPQAPLSVLEEMDDIPF